MSGGCPYRLLRLLRRTVSTATFEAAGNGGGTVVVKQLVTEGRAADPLGAMHFEREVALSTMLRHPGLASVAGHGGGWIAFEHLEQPGSDTERLKRLATLSGVRTLTGQLADTLAYLHSRGIVHRDVKPGHILFRGEQPVLIDLGIAGLAAGDPLAKAELAGSPAWMAPEQVAGARPAPSADIWSLCAVAAALLSGRPFFVGSADSVLAERRREGASALPLPDALAADPAFLDLVRAGLGPPEERPRAAEIARLLAPAPLRR